jgi:hypothetical protein
MSADHEYIKEFVNRRLSIIDEKIFGGSIAKNAGKFIFEGIKMKMYIMHSQVTIAYSYEKQNIANMTIQSQDKQLLYELTHEIINRAGDLVTYNTNNLEFMNTKIIKKDEDDDIDIFGYNMN